MEKEILIQFTGTFYTATKGFYGRVNISEHDGTVTMYKDRVSYEIRDMALNYYRKMPYNKGHAFFDPQCRIPIRLGRVKAHQKFEEIINKEKKTLSSLNHLTKKGTPRVEYLKQQALVKKLEEIASKILPNSVKFIIESSDEIE